MTDRGSVSKKLTLHRETLQILELPDTATVQGALAGGDINPNIYVRSPNSNACPPITPGCDRY